jgi:hypothetical protein
MTFYQVPTSMNLGCARDEKWTQSIVLFEVTTTKVTNMPDIHKSSHAGAEDSSAGSK